MYYNEASRTFTSFKQKEESQLSVIEFSSSCRLPFSCLQTHVRLQLQMTNSQSLKRLPDTKNPQTIRREQFL